MFGKGKTILGAILLGMICCVLAGPQKRCNVRTGMKGRAKIPGFCDEGLITFEYPWMINPYRCLQVRTKNHSPNYNLCIYSCTQDVLVGSRRRLLKKGEIWCMKKGQRITLKKSSDMMAYSVLFRYFNQSNRKAFEDNPNKGC
ncbi:uncharacterized protein [Argopecten irradians]|uniref:uncharacterized protein n=1 Tax=Argopecten irradians TaxID=31199 RepID=UPI00371C84E0